jgi:hypothetical protein
MAALPRFLDRVLADGVAIVADFPPACTPIVGGRIGTLDPRLGLGPA